LTLPAANDPIWNSFNAQGFGYIGMIVDGLNTVGEFDETNNTNSGLLQDLDTLQLNRQQGELMVTINRLRGDFDRGPSDSDFYTWVLIDRVWDRSPTKTGNNITPNWRFSQFTTGFTVPIVIQVYEADSGFRGSDNHIDIDPRPAERDLHLSYNLFTGEITGDLYGFQGERLRSSGDGDSDQGEIEFTVNFSPV
jgi:hypothetical protein